MAAVAGELPPVGATAGGPDIDGKDADAVPTGGRDKLGIERAAINQEPGLRMRLEATVLPPQLDLGSRAWARSIEDISGTEKRELLGHSGRQGLTVVTTRGRSAHDQHDPMAELGKAQRHGGTRGSCADDRDLGGSGHAKSCDPDGSRAPNSSGCTAESRA